MTFSTKRPKCRYVCCIHILYVMLLQLWKWIAIILFLLLFPISLDFGYWLPKLRIFVVTTGLFTTCFHFPVDNGGVGKKGNAESSNWPLRGAKNTLWEGGIKGIAFVNSPLLPSSAVGTVQTALMHVSDWLPTLVEGVAGGVAEGRLPLDGFNMWPTIAWVMSRTNPTTIDFVMYVPLEEGPVSESHKVHIAPFVFSTSCILYSTL